MDVNRLFESSIDREYREKCEIEILQLSKELLRSVFQHPSNRRIYDVKYIYINRTENCIAAYRSPINGLQPKPDDHLSFRVLGPDGIQDAG